MQFERGENSVEAVLLVPVVFLMLLLGVQCAAIFHAGNVATAAAAQGAVAAAAFGAGPINGERAATVSAIELGATLVGAPVVAFSPRDVQVSVTLRVPQIVPGFPESLTRSAIESREEFIAERDR